MLVSFTASAQNKSTAFAEIGPSYSFGAAIDKPIGGHFGIAFSPSIDFSFGVSGIKL